MIIITHISNKSKIDRKKVINIFRGRIKVWPNGKAIKTILLNNFKIHDYFCKEILKITPKKLLKYWKLVIFAGKGNPPKELLSEKAVIDYVKRNQNAIGYIKASSDCDGVTITKLK